MEQVGRYPLLPTADVHINRESSWPKLRLQSRGPSTGSAVSPWTLLAVWSPVPLATDHILSLAASFTFISLGSRKK